MDRRYTFLKVVRPGLARLAASVGSAAFVFLIAFSLEAETYEVLHDFAPRSAQPLSGVVADASGNLYGTTFSGGTHRLGTVYMLDAANGYALTTLHSFEGPDGSAPYAALVTDASGNLYGTTSSGGTSNFGTVFKLDAANGYVLTTLHSFDGSDGWSPYAELIADASGNLYGTTPGSSGGIGTVFKLDAANGYALTTLHGFSGPDGGGPVAALIADASGNLYGTTSGGGQSGFGTVFKLDAANDYALTTLHSFDGPDGANPQAALIACNSGNLYGTTSGGGLSDLGTVFKLDAANDYALTTLHSFAGPDGKDPLAAVVADASGNLYGTTGSGGSDNFGTVFKLDAANGYALTTLHSFAGPDGAGPYHVALIADASGNLYGTTTRGGPDDYSGVVFKLDAANGYALAILRGFSGPGTGPVAALIADASGNLYGTTSGGGPYGAGTVFKLDAANNYARTTLHSFTGPDGLQPQAAVIADASGNLYGTTWGGGLSGSGTVFKLDSANSYALTTLHDFDPAAFEGTGPVAALLADASGNLYGTTLSGGFDGWGTVFKLDAANSYALKTLHYFDPYFEGINPEGALIADASGNLYGTTSFGGGVFKLDAANAYALRVLHWFDGSDGLWSRAAVLADASGNLYGTTSQGGPDDFGTVFKLDASSNYALTTLHSFSGPDGASPFAGLIADASGNLYGTTSGGGSNNFGTVFKLDAANDYALTTLHSFDGPDGGGPSAALLADAAGTFFGTTAGGGAWDAGVAFALTTGTPAAIAGIAPTSGPSGGGTAVTITGTGFSATLTVRIGGALATGVTVVSPTEITATTPPLPPGRLNDVAVTNGPFDPSVLSGGFFSDFLDVPQDDAFHSYIETIFRNGITAGCGGGAYCQDSPVTRAQMAVFLLKAKLGSVHVPPACTGTVFLDVPCTGGPFDPWIEELASQGITGGCGGGNYCPDATVTRQQMAVFLLKAYDGSSYTPPVCTGIFGDVPCTPGIGFPDWIEEIYNRAITGGCQASPLLYCPTNPNTRRQMAVFLVKTFGL